MWVDDFAETPEANDQTSAEPDEAARREDGKGKRVAGAVKAVKGFLKDERVAVAAMAVATAVLAEVLARRPGVGTGIENFELPPDAGAEDVDPSPAPVVEGSKRRGPERHQVKGALVDLGDRQASPTAQENYRRDGGGDLPPGKTYRQPHSRGGPEPEDFGLSV